MKELYQKHKEVILYLIFGVLTTLVNIGVYYIFNDLMHIHYQVSTIIAWILSVLFAFVTNKFYVFESRNKSHKESMKEVFSFFVCRIVSLGFDMVSMFFFFELLKVPSMISKVIANVIVVIANYVFSKVFVFRK